MTFQDELKIVRDAYANDTKQEKVNVLLLGESGSGKTYILRTARLPVHIDSFDPGGTKSVKDMIDKGDIVADTSFEHEDPKSPKAFEKWLGVFNKRVTSGYFKHFGTYALDSSTTFSEAIMNYVLQKAGRPGQAPQRNHDYVPQKVHLTNALKSVLNLPCDVVLTGHLKPMEDPVDEKTVLRFLAVGQAMVTIPLLFDEIWVTAPTNSPTGVNYRLMLRSTGTYMARSRLLGAMGDKIKEKHFNPNIKEVLKLCGYSVADLPKLSEVTA